MHEPCLSSEEGPYDYEELKEDLLRIFNALNKPTAFACHAPKTVAPNPGLSINGLGGVGLPLSERDAKAIITKCHQSPFGKGSETLIDTTIRKSYELNVHEFSLCNPEWSSFISNLVTFVHQQLTLTCNVENVHAELYKLLLYEEGAFFKPHQDSEKTPGMFGTLVVCLPSLHEGGRIVLSHNKENYTFDSASNSAFGTTFAAWYSDVFHQVEPVTLGYRLVLTYNLVQGGDRIPQHAPDGDTKANLIEILTQFEKRAADDDGYASLVAHKLEHSYTQTGLSMSNLKGKDFAIVRLLCDACRSADFDIYLATFEKEVSRDDDTGSNIYESTESFTYVTSLDGEPQKLSFNYYSGCIMWDTENEADGEADESEHEGYTGNAGCPATYWYRDTVVLIVPPSRKVDACLDVDKLSYKPAMSMMDKLQCETQKEPANQNKLLRLCKKLLPHVIYATSISKQATNNEALQCRERIIAVALQLEDTDLFAHAACGLSFSAKVLSKFIQVLLKSGLTYWTPAIIQLLDAAVSVAAKWSILKPILNFLTGTPEGDGPAFDEWTREMFNLILENAERARRADGEAFAQMALSRYTDAEKEIVPHVLDTNVVVVSSFILKYYNSIFRWTDVEHTRLLDMLIQHLWDNFEFFSVHQTQYAGIHNLPPNRNVTEIESLTCDELITLVGISLKLPGTDTTTIFKQLAHASFSVTSDYLKDTLMPFAEALVSQKISTIDNKVDSACSFVKFILHLFISKFVQYEPVRPQDWAMPVSTVSCKCEDCKAASAFFACPTVKQIDMLINQKRKAHVQSHFDPPHVGVSFRTEIRRDTKPHALRITKNHQTWITEHRRWTMRHKEAVRTMRKLGGGEGCPKLQPWLGKWSAYFVSCKTETLPPLEEITQWLPLQESNANTAGNRTNKRKRNGNDDTESSTQKKTVTSERDKDVAVIDLT